MRDEVLFKPRAIKGFSRKTVLYIPVDSLSGTIKKALSETAIKKKAWIGADLFLMEDKVIVLGGIGAPAAVISLESLIVSGAEDVIILGFCGALNTKFKLLDAVSIKKAFSEEGTSRHYLSGRTEFFPSRILSDKIEGVLQSKGLSFQSGNIVSTDAPFRETRAWLESNKGRGVDCIDMESSAVFALAEFYGIQAAALLIVSDKFYKSKHITGFLHPGMSRKIKKYVLPFIGKAVNGK